VAITLVGVAGGIGSSTGASVTPAFGQATTLGNLLICCAISTTNSAFSITGPSGWVNINAAGQAGGRAEIWYKPNCGAGETAPTVNCTLATLMDAALSEWTVAASAPLDTSGTGTSGVATSLTVTTGASVGGGGGGIGISAFAALSVAATTGTWGPGAGWVNLVNDFPSLVVGHFASDYLLVPPIGATLSETGSVSGFTPAGMVGVVATFLPGDVPIIYARGAN
jgi:hypothetical protein